MAATALRRRSPRRRPGRGAFTFAFAFAFPSASASAFLRFLPLLPTRQSPHLPLFLSCLFSCFLVFDARRRSTFARWTTPSPRASRTRWSSFAGGAAELFRYASSGAAVAPRAASRATLLRTASAPLSRTSSFCATCTSKSRHACRRCASCDCTCVGAVVRSWRPALGNVLASELASRPS